MLEKDILVDKSITNNRIKKEKAYWMEKLSGDLTICSFPVDQKIQKDKDSAMNSFTFFIPKNIAEEINKVCKFSEHNLFIFLLSGVYFTAYKYTGDEDIIIGCPILKQQKEGNYLNNIVSLRVGIDGKLKFKEFILKIKEVFYEANENVNCPIESIVESLGFTMSSNHIPLFNIFVAFNNIHNFKVVEDINCNTVFSFVMEDGSIKCEVRYNSNLYTKNTIERLSKSFINFFSCIVQNYNILLSEIDVLSNDEKRQLLLDFNNTQGHYIYNKTVHELFEEQVTRMKHTPALIYGNNKLSYLELNNRINKLACILRTNGVKSNSIVGILTKRSFEMIIGILAVLKAGGAYVPIDPEYPIERITYILDDSGAKILLCNKLLVKSMNVNIKTIDIDDEDNYFEGYENLQNVNTPNDLAYIIYTSGSTGTPKGVLIEHRNIVNFIEAMSTSIDFSSNKTILNLTTISFDIFVLETLLPLVKGLTIVIAGENEQRDTKLLSDIVIKNKVDILQTTPSRMKLILSNNKECIKELKEIIIGGEPFTQNLADEITKSSCAKLFNVYGPTETTIWSTIKELNKGDIVNIGRPILNTEIYIIDKYNNIQPIGAIGELCISGAGLARGYLNRNELMEQKFIPNPFSQYKNMYKTGDKARWLENGEIEFLGRIDEQVKVNGHRIELGEIESQIEQYENIECAAAIDKVDQDGNIYIYVYIESKEKIDIAQIRNFISKKLPYYMIPHSIKIIDKMPYHASGKVNKKLLRQLEFDEDKKYSYEPISNEIELKLIPIWQNILGIKYIDVNTNFFVQGGHSLSAIKVISKVYDEFQVNLEMRDLFNNPVIKDFAKVINKHNKTINLPIKVVDEQEYYPLSPAQKRLFIIQNIEEENTAYNNPVALKIEGLIDKNKFETAIRVVVTRHEAMRTSFHIINGEPAQKIHKNLDFDIHYYNTKEHELDYEISKFIEPFDITIAPIFRIGFFKYHDQKQVLVFDIHHICCDGISVYTILQDIFNFYNNNSLEELKVQYKDFIVWQNNVYTGEYLKKQEAYWISKFTEEIPILNLPIDFSKTSILSHKGKTFYFEVDTELTNRIIQLSIQSNTTLQMIFFAAYSILLSLYSSQKDIIIGMPVSLRSGEDIDKLVAMCVNTLAIRCKLNYSDSFNEYLLYIRDNLLEVYENKYYQFEELVQKLELPRESGRNPIFDTMFVYQSEDIDNSLVHDLDISTFRFQRNISKYYLTLHVINKTGKLQFNFEYCTELFKEETIRRMAGHFINILEDILNNPNISLTDIEIISEEERKRILVNYNNTSIKYPKNATLNSIFDNQVKKSPDSVCAVIGGKSLTYIELDKHSNKIAGVLKRKGIGRDKIVGIMAERSFEMLIGMIAIIKAGGAYLPINPEYPDERIRYMLNDSESRVLLTQSKFAGKSEFRVDTIEIERILEDPTEHVWIEELTTCETDLAYVIYTSGSTGEPKGAMIEHRSIVNRINWMQRQYPLNKDDVILQKTPITFDVSVWELFWYTFCGAKVCLLEPGTENNPEEIVRTIKESGVTVMHFVPSMLGAFLEYVDRQGIIESLLSLKFVFSSGEALKPQHVKKFKSLFGKTVILVNLYGPTEAAVDVSYYDCNDEDLDIVPIGKPIDNIKLYITDNNGKLQPEGIPGELWISGEGVGRGYINRRELTEEKFISDPFNLGQRVYRTGDLARWISDGNIEFLGRWDGQVKIRGFRIEMGEIEAQLLKYDGISEAVVVAMEDDNGEKKLCAYIVCEYELQINYIKNFLSQNIPKYMIPSFIVRIPQIPITPNGKLNKNALPKPALNIEDNSKFEVPQDEIQLGIYEIWKDLLGNDYISINENFFDIGGSSILLIRMFNELNRLYPNTLKITEIFGHSTIGKIAKLIRSRLDANRQTTELKPMFIHNTYLLESKILSIKKGILRFEINASMFNNLKLAAEKNEVNISQVLLGVFLHLFSDVSENIEFTVYMAMREVNKFIPININKSKLNSLLDYLAITKNMEHNNFINSITTTDLQEIDKKFKGSHVKALFYRRDYANLSVNLIEHFDIVFETNLNDYRANILIEYRSNLLKPEKVKSIVTKYINLITQFINTYKSN